VEVFGVRCLLASLACFLLQGRPYILSDNRFLLVLFLTQAFPRHWTPVLPLAEYRRAHQSITPSQRTKLDRFEVCSHSPHQALQEKRTCSGGAVVKSISLLSPVKVAGPTKSRAIFRGVIPRSGASGRARWRAHTKQQSKALNLHRRDHARDGSCRLCERSVSGRGRPKGCAQWASERVE